MKKYYSVNTNVRRKNREQELIQGCNSFPRLVLEDVRLGYRYNRSVVTAQCVAFCRGLSAIVGPSGSGKSTLLSSLAGFMVPLQGTIDYQRGLVSTVPPRIAYLFQSTPDLVSTLPADVQVALPLLNDGMYYSDAIDQAHAYLAKLGVERKRHRQLPHRLSGGEKQRVAIARAACQDSEVLIADEPTANLDRGNSQEVFKLLKSLSAKQIVVVATHDCELARQYSDHVFSIDDGQLQESVAFRQSEAAQSILANDQFCPGRVFSHPHQIRNGYNKPF